jgi:hypothetical protein
MAPLSTRSASYRLRLLAVVRFAVVRFREPPELLAALVFLRVVRLRVDFRPVDFRPVDFRPVVFRRLVAAAFLPARDLAAVFRLRVAAAFLAAAERFREVVVRFRVVVRLRVVLLRVATMCHLLSHRQDAMRFRRRRSRSLMPPHTPYRSSRRSA